MSTVIARPRAVVPGFAVEDYEGLVKTTARMNLHSLGGDMSFDDIAQLLRIKIWLTLPKFDASRSTKGVRSFIFGALTNYIKDLQKSERRRKARGIPYSLETYLDTVVSSDGGGDRTIRELSSTPDFEQHVEGLDHVLGRLALGHPAHPVAVLLCEGRTRAEISDEMGLSLGRVGTIIAQIRSAVADAM